jgi:hypothetical protein
MLGLSLGRQYRDPINSEPAIPAIAEQFYIDKTGSECGSPTYGLDLLDLTNATLSFSSSTVTMTSSVAGVYSFLNITNLPDVDSVTLIPSFQGKSNVLRIVVGKDLGSKLGLNRFGGTIRTILKDSSDQFIAFRDIAHPDWSHHVELTYWVDTDYENNQWNGSIPETVSGDAYFGFGGDDLEAVRDSEIVSSLADPRDTWSTIKIDIFDQTIDNNPGITPGTQPILEADNDPSYNQSQFIMGLPAVYSDSYPPGWPSIDPATHFGASALYIAGIKHNVCPRT